MNLGSLNALKLFGPRRFYSKVKEEAVRVRLGEELTLMKIQALHHTGSRDSLQQALLLIQGRLQGQPSAGSTPHTG